MTVIKWLLAFCLLAILAGIFLGPVNPGLRKARESRAMQTSRTIALAMFQYANDHQGKYPAVRSSTEVFQQLLDQNYVTDSKVFYVELPGKTPPTSNKLKSENVSWDVTSPFDASSSNDVPVVFLTGYRVSYVPGGKAVPLARPTSFEADGIPVCYHSNTAWFKRTASHAVPSSHTEPDGVVENFVPTTFRSNGQNYQQLTPEGPLPPSP
jgi:type II secretory pathway pseudopilin PulG